MYPPPESVYWGIAEMIAADKAALTLRGGVAGPDRFSWSQVKGVTSGRLASLFKTWYGS